MFHSMDIMKSKTFPLSSPLLAFIKLNFNEVLIALFWQLLLIKTNKLKIIQLIDHRIYQVVKREDTIEAWSKKYAK
jgi:hypothetical protein